MKSSNLKTDRKSIILKELDDFLDKKNNKNFHAFVVNVMANSDKKTFEYVLNKIDKDVLLEEQKEFVFGNLLILNKYDHALSFFNRFPFKTLDEIYLASSLVSKDIDKLKNIMSLVDIRFDEMQYILSNYIFRGDLKGIELVSSKISVKEKINLVKHLSASINFEEGVKTGISCFLNTMPDKDVLKLKPCLDNILDSHSPNIITDAIMLKIKQISDKKILKENIKPSLTQKTTRKI